MRLSQNFLRNEKILRWLGSLTYGKVLEIGAGDGRLSRHLNYTELWMVEVDKRLCSKLEELSLPNSHLICQDFLKVEPFSVDVIIGNIPYHISSPIIFRLLDWEFREAILMVQKEFGEKMVAKPGASNYGRLSVTSQLCFDVKILRYVPRKLFSPPPKVDSVVIQLIKKRKLTPEEDELIRLLFSQKNKKVKNILPKGYVYPPELAEMRPRHLTPEEILSIRKVS
jgi:16S rRNA (adenine1518-N6/adenine1519-N6)-dimethyltransferase